MFGVVIVSQGGLARELLAAGRKIAGGLDEGFRAVSLSWEEGVEAAREEIGEAVRQVDAGQGVLVLVDMYGSTPCNAALGLLDPGRVEILTGVNLPMVVRLGCLTAPLTTLPEAVEWLQGKGQKSICQARGRWQPATAGESPCEPQAVGEGQATVASAVEQDRG